MRRPTLPISLFLANRLVVVVTNGATGAERVKRLNAAGAQVQEVQRTDYMESLLNGAMMVIAQTGDSDFDAKIVQEARKQHVPWCYAHDQPDVSDFAMPALIAHGPLKLAISTDAVAPALARRLREQISPLFAAAADRVALLMEELTSIRATMASGSERASRLYSVASRLHIKGNISIDEKSPSQGSTD